MSDVTELEKMEQQIEAVIARMNQHERTKRANSLTVLASKFKRYEQRCLALAKTNEQQKESGEMVIYEIMNPSDKCFIEGTDFKTVCIATIFLGEGKYGLEQIEPKGYLSMPPIIFAKSWFSERFGQTVEEAIKTSDKNSLRDVLSTVKLAGEQSSLNDIVGRAKDMVKMLGKEEKAVKLK